MFAMCLCGLDLTCCLPDGKVLCKLEGWVLLQNGFDKPKAKAKARRSSAASHTSHRKSHKANAAHWSQPKPPRRIQLALPRLVIIPPSFSLLSEVLAGNATARLRLRSNICTLSGRRFSSSPSSPHIKRFLSYSLYLPTLNGMPEGKAEDRVRHSFRKLTTFIEN